jgi:hypothetical protein
MEMVWEEGEYKFAIYPSEDNLTTMVEISYKTIENLLEKFSIEFIQKKTTGYQECSTLVINFLTTSKSENSHELAKLIILLVVKNFSLIFENLEVSFKNIPIFEEGKIFIRWAYSHIPELVTRQVEAKTFLISSTRISKQIIVMWARN